MHGGLNRHELNTLLVVRTPDRAEGRVDRGAAGVVDLAPTILDLLGLEAPGSMVGRSLARPPAEPERSSLFETGAGGFGQSLRLAEIGRARMLVSGGRSV
jgi:arylsulfatase A-like enzyme